MQRFPDKKAAAFGSISEEALALTKASHYPADPHRTDRFLCDLLYHLQRRCAPTGVHPTIRRAQALGSYQLQMRHCDMLTIYGVMTILNEARQDDHAQQVKGRGSRALATPSSVSLHARVTFPDPPEFPSILLSISVVEYPPPLFCRIVAEQPEPVTVFKVVEALARNLKQYPPYPDDIRTPQEQAAFDPPYAIKNVTPGLRKPDEKKP